MRYEPRHAGEGTSTTNTTLYLHKDHLGSVVVITSETGAVVESLAYDARGKRRPATTWQTPTPGVFMAAITLTRGFTMHEHLDQVGLVHMGGRVYDPEIGRFLSPDPFVQFPFSTQGFNRYTYVSNNPLSYTDPSGYFLKKLGRYLALPAAVFIPNPILAGAVAGYLGSGGDLRAAALGAVGGAIFHSIGNHFNEVSFGSAAHMQKTLAHGVAGGLLSRAGGGRFGDGFLGAGAGQMMAPGIDRIGRSAGGQIATDPASRLARVASAAAVGGTASSIGGGKFANGAISAGFARAMNDEFHIGGHSQEITEEQRRLAAAGDVGAFWESRQAGGDPIAAVALESLNPSGGAIDYLFGGTSINNRLQAFARVYGGGELNVDQVRVELMRAHVIAVDADARGVIGLLNPRQVAAYHHSVFAGHGLPPTAFGGTPFTGTLREATVWRRIWCAGCDR